MKTLLFLLLSAVTFAQGHLAFVAGADIRNGIQGSDPTGNKPELNLLVRFEAITESGLGAVVFYEGFKAIEFQKYGVGFKQEFKLKEKLTVGYILEPTIIKRNWGQLPIYDAYQFYNLINSNPEYDENTEFTQQELLDAGVDIIGYEDNKVRYLSFGISVPVSYMLTKNIGVELQYNGLYRTDLKDRYGDSKIVHSYYLNLLFRF